MYLQDLIFTLQKFWADRGCVIEQPVDVEVGAGTFHPATFLRVLGPEPWNAAFAQFCRRPSDGRYGDNPNRAGAYYQFQVGLKPSPLHVRTSISTRSARSASIPRATTSASSRTTGVPDPRRVGLGWEVWCDGMEVTQFTYFQQAGGIDLLPVTAELTYGVERLAMYLQDKKSMYDLQWDKNVTYGQLRHPWEVEYSTYHFEELVAENAFRAFDTYEAECKRLLDARAGAARLRVLHEEQPPVQLARRARRDQRHRARAVHRARARDGAACAHAYVGSRAKLEFPLLPPHLRAQAVARTAGPRRPA